MSKDYRIRKQKQLRTYVERVNRYKTVNSIITKSHNNLVISLDSNN